MIIHGRYQVTEAKLFFIMENKKWYITKETKSILKISDCELIHLRLEGKIELKKVVFLILILMIFLNYFFINLKS